MCSYPVRLVNDQIINAFADGKNIIVTAGLMRFVESDDELALIVGHELAHNTMEHIQKNEQTSSQDKLLERFLIFTSGRPGFSVNLVNL